MFVVAAFDFHINQTVRETFDCHIGMTGYTLTSFKSSAVTK
jgi:hypothetical protein